MQYNYLNNCIVPFRVLYSTFFSYAPLLTAIPDPDPSLSLLTQHFSFFNSFLNFYVFLNVFCQNECVYLMSLRLANIIGSLILWDWNYRGLYAAMWNLGIEACPQQEQNMILVSFFSSARILKI